jgi:pilus assembly protein Flp/PilA
MFLRKKILHRCGEFLREEDGPTSVEYAVMIALILVACAATVNSLAVQLRTNFDTSANAIQQASN